MDSLRRSKALFSHLCYRKNGTRSGATCVSAGFQFAALARSLPVVAWIAIFAMILAEFALADDVLWPTEIRRIDPGNQNYERLPPKLPTVVPNARPAGSFRIRGFFRVRNSASFIYNKRVYKLRDAEPIDNSKICLHEDGRQWGCGIMARNTFRELLTSKDVFCRPVEETEAWTFVRCGKEGFDVADKMIDCGFALMP